MGGGLPLLMPNHICPENILKSFFFFFYQLLPLGVARTVIFAHEQTIAGFVFLSFLSKRLNPTVSLIY